MEIVHQVAIDLFAVVCRESYAVVVYITTHKVKNLISLHINPTLFC